jgi:8-oxo-dGTP pyrophosphatase MutT (NUDIX family)
VDENDRHSGQVAYPGGRCSDLDQSTEDTAIREAQEEIGVKPADIQILGRLRDMLTITNYRVTPYVGIIPWPYPLIPQPEEVAHIFSIPLEWLANPENREIRMRGLQILGQDIPVLYFKKFDSERLWGASARITLLFLEALGLSAPANRYCNHKVENK